MYALFLRMKERKVKMLTYSIHDDTNGKNNIFFTAYVKKTYQRGKRKKKLRFLQVFVKLSFIIKIPLQLRIKSYSKQTRPI
jgi:hypothetical protein